jgi:hypothetical protein
MRVLATSAGFEIRGDASQVLFIDRGGRVESVFLWIVFGLAGMAWLWTVLPLALPVQGIEASSAWIASGVALVCAVGLSWLFVTMRRGLQRRQEAEVAPFLVIDLHARVLRDGRGNVLAPLDQCSVRKAMLITSSAPSVQIRWRSGKREVFRGGIMGGGVADAIAMLRGLGLR